MSFRNDHDAALARIDALEQENRQLADENAKLRAGATRLKPPLVARGLTAVRTSAGDVAYKTAHIRDAPRDVQTLTVIGVIIMVALMIATWMSSQ